MPRRAPGRLRAPARRPLHTECVVLHPVWGEISCTQCNNASESLETMCHCPAVPPVSSLTVAMLSFEKSGAGTICVFSSIVYVRPRSPTSQRAVPHSNN